MASFNRKQCGGLFVTINAHVPVVVSPIHKKQQWKKHLDYSLGLFVRGKKLNRAESDKSHVAELRHFYFGDGS